MTETALSAASIGLRQNGADIFRDISVRVIPGSVSVLIGPSGAGKSSILRALSMVVPPSVGTVLMDGRVMPPWPTEGADYWPQVTLVFQQQFLWPHMTLWENVVLAGAGSPHWNAEYAMALAHRLGLTNVLERRPSSASVGERQRVALVRAAALQPRYLLLDEPTTSLDVENAAVVVALIREWKEIGVGVLVATHAIGVARTLADRVYFIDRGDCVEEGGPEILKDPGTERLRRFLLVA